MQTGFTRATLLSALVFITPFVSAELEGTDQAAEVKVKVEKISDNIRFIHCGFSNVVLFEGQDGLVLVDTPFKPDYSYALKAEIKTESNKPLKYILNTHAHIDHTGGNDILGADGACIIAQDNVEKRCGPNPVWPNGKLTEIGMPDITFSDTLTLHYGSEEIDMLHPRSGTGHSDSDAVVFFRKENVIVTGGIFSKGTYPDIQEGSINRLIANAEEILNLIDDGTKIACGHSGIASKGDLREFVAMLKDIRSRVQKLVAEGKTRDEVVKAKPTETYDATHSNGYVKPDDFAAQVYTSLARDNATSEKP